MRRLLPALLAAATLLAAWPARAQEQGFREVVPRRDWSFPDDHGNHPDYASEWWYLTGHLEDEEGDRFAVQAVFFRQALPPLPSAPEGWTPPVLFPAHMAVTDLQRGTFAIREVVGRDLGGLAGAKEDALEVRTRGWSLRTAPGGNWLLQTGERSPASGGPGLDLVLDPAEPPLLHGEEGYSRKTPGRPGGPASWYYSIPRLKARGRLIIEDGVRQVEGTLWFDHEFFRTGVLTDLEGWDWFGLRMDDGSSLMLSRVRAGGGTYLWGTWRGPGGEVLGLRGEDLRLEPLDSWESPDGKARYPVQWRVEVLPLGLEAVVAAQVPASELRTERSTLVRYWEGGVTVRRSGVRIGEGFLEMIGYAGPILPGGGTPPPRPR